MMENKLPKGWAFPVLGEVVSIKSGNSSLTKKVYKEDGQYIAYSGSGPDGKVDFFEEEGDAIILSAVGARCGKCFKAHGKWTTIANTSIIRTFLNNQKHIDYIFYLLNNENFWPRGGTGQPFVKTVKAQKEINVPLPPLPEQSRIVAKLDALMQKVEINKQRLDKIPVILKRFRQSVLAAAVSGKLTHEKMEDNNLPNNWSVANGKNVFEFITSGSRGWADYYSDEGTLFIRVTNLDYDTIRVNVAPSKNKYVNPPLNSEGTRTKVKYNDVLISITGDVGMVGFIETEFQEAYVNQHVCLARPKQQYFAKYIAYFISAMNGGRKYFDEVKKGATKAGLGLNDIRELPVSIPPLEIQHEIVRRIEQLFDFSDMIETRYTKAKAMLDKLPQSILAKAFRGELVAQDPDDETAERLLERILNEKRIITSSKRGKG